MAHAGQRPIVIRRKKAASHASHGAWKIAYADFMTAMMAFFLVMWLLSGLDSEELAAVNQYFQTPLKVAMAGGDRYSASNSAIPGGGDDPMHSEGEVALTTREATNYRPSHRSLQRLQGTLQAMIEGDPEFQGLEAQVQLEEVTDGLRIQISDSEARPMFELGSADIAPYIATVLHKIAPRINALPNRITLTGHTDDLRFVTGERAYSNWELSTDRANAARRELIEGGMDGGKLLRVIGAAATASRSNAPSDAPVNRRITILVLDDRAQARLEQDDPGLSQPASTPSERARWPMPVGALGVDMSVQSG